jgi:two-component system sensor histidine kinase CpxA
MQRLYWKFFVSFWIALLLFAATSLLFTSHYLDRLRAQQDAGAPRERYEQRIAQARDLAQQHGLQGLKDWAHEVDEHEAVPLLVLDAAGDDVLGRDVPAQALEHLRRHDERAERPRNMMRGMRPEPSIVLDDGSRYRIVPDLQGVTLGRLLGRPRVIAVPLLLGTLISALVCLLLARYLTAPIERLRRAAEAYAAGDLTQRVGASLGGRRDEIVDLALAFDHMAERLNELMLSHKQLLRDVSHELRSPLARLQAALGLARQRAGTATQPELDRIEDEAERLNELIGQLLSLARLEAGAQDTPLESVNLSELLTTVTEDATLEAGVRQCEVRLQQPALLCVRGNVKLLHSALENVVRNAIHYTAAGSAVTITASQTDGRVLIRVTDHGPGVPEQMLPRMFEPFVRVGEARDRRSGGYGLGLAIAKRAIGLHGGEISARNEAAGGLCVIISLPAAGAHSREATA